MNIINEWEQLAVWWFSDAVNIRANSLFSTGGRAARVGQRAAAHGRHWGAPIGLHVEH